MQFVYQPRVQVLANRVHTAAEANVLRAGGFPGACERSLDPVGYEMEDGAAFHLEGRARVMREDEDRHVVGRVLAPPASPGFDVPHDSDRTEHVPSHRPCTEVLEPPTREVIVGPGPARAGCAL